MLKVWNGQRGSGKGNLKVGNDLFAPGSVVDISPEALEGFTGIDAKGFSDIPKNAKAEVSKPLPVKKVN